MGNTDNNYLSTREISMKFRSLQQRKSQKIRDKKCSRFTSGVVLYLISCLIVILGQQIGSYAQQQSEQQQEVSHQMISQTIGVAQQQQQQATLKSTIPLAGKIGQAPHDRPACQLPLTGNLRRYQPLTGNDRTMENEPNKLQVTTNNNTKATTRTNTNLAVTQPAFMSLANGSGLGARSQLQPVANKRFDSSERLRQLRQLLASNSYDAYLITPNDEHGSEYVSDYDRRLRFISGFNGSNGFALILLDRAVLFTDGRYALQADQDLDCNWWLVVSDDPLIDIPLWLKANAASGLKIATDARLMSLQSFDYLDEHIRRQDSEFALISQDLIDAVWNQNETLRSKSQDKIFVHPLPFAGNVTWQEKLIKLSESMGKLRARHYILSKLDDIAWLLNLRGNDIPMTPLFKAYLLISRSLPVSSGEQSKLAAVSSPAISSVEQLLASTRQPQHQQQQQAATLMAPQVLQVEPSQTIKVTLYVDLKKLDQQIRDHLHVDNGTIIVHSIQQPAHRGSAASASQMSSPLTSDSSSSSSLGDSISGPTGNVVTTRIQVELKDHEVFIMDMREKLSPGVRQLQGRLLLNAGANVAIHVLAKNFDDRLVLVESLVNKLKAVKSDGEVQGMRLAHWRDSLAISMLLAQLDLDIGHRGQINRWSEVSASQELEFYRSLMDYNRGQSFETISAYGSNGAIVHYAPDYGDENPRLIGNTSTYLLDSGGQYLDGTTDITRTTHYGEPTEFQRETYTRVLMGSIDVMSLIFDQPIRGAYRINDMLARRHLFELGLDYPHGTGHGIGLYSLVHEDPYLIENYATSTNAKRQQATSKQSTTIPVHSEPLPLQANMFTSVEPGYYKANDFGIRLENIVVTQRVNLPASLSRPNDRQAETSSDRMKIASGGEQRQFLRFEPLSLVPFEPKLIKLELLSNKQKAWLNSYNLMIRLRMTQQINYYLNKIRGHQAQPIQVQYTASSSRLYHQLLQHKQPAGSLVSNTIQVINSSRSNDLERSGQYNFLRLEGSQLQEKLEMTHRWIMSKTELIPLDVPQSMVNTSQQHQQQQQQQVPITNGQTAGKSLLDSIGGRKRSHDQQQQQQQAQNLDSQRLMLVYMASLPFNDQEAGEAAYAAATNEASSPLLGGRMATSGGGGGKSTSSDPSDATNIPNSPSSAHLAEANKCTGFECDLWLLGSLNRASAAQYQQQQHQHRGHRGDHSSSWLSEAQTDDIDDNDDHSAKSLLSNFKLWDLFQIHGNSMGQTLPINMWSMVVLGLLIVLQLGIVSFMCQRRRRATRGASGTLCPIQSPPTSTSNNNNNN